MNRKPNPATSLIEGARREKRRGLLLGFAGACIVIGLVALYVVGLRDSGLPDVPMDSAPMPSGAVPARIAPVRVVERAPEPPPAAPEKAPAAIVEVALPRAVPLWVDDASAGKVKAHRAELTPGQHRLRAKVGKQVVQQAIEVVAGASYDVTLDEKKSRFVVKRTDGAGARLERPGPSRQ